MGRMCPVYFTKNLITEQQLSGYLNLETFEIFIDASFAQKEKENEFWHVLIHEIVHAAWFRSGIYQTKLSHDVEEIVCEVLSVVFNENFSLKLKNAKQSNRPGKSRRKKLVVPASEALPKTNENERKL